MENNKQLNYILLMQFNLFYVNMSFSVNVENIRTKLARKYPTGLASLGQELRNEL